MIHQRVPKIDPLEVSSKNNFLTPTPPSWSLSSSEPLSRSKRIEEQAGDDTSANGRPNDGSELRTLWTAPTSFESCHPPILPPLASMGLDPTLASIASDDEVINTTTRTEAPRQSQHHHTLPSTFDQNAINTMIRPEAPRQSQHHPTLPSIVFDQNIINTTTRPEVPRQSQYHPIRPSTDFDQNAIDTTTRLVSTPEVRPMHVVSNSRSVL